MHPRRIFFALPGAVPPSDPSGLAHHWPSRIHVAGTPHLKHVSSADFQALDNLNQIAGPFDFLTSLSVAINGLSQRA
ncbi:hypothetical protein CALCODRAFT_493787 [Calocera cornea HHB12733]|uniref:Uncharacterized protein n=1 Tax=Calocera cornea HHB12733 TaxID=1353952 RepID=A0A165HFS5_9BASI|nr:hypothetical protein CALCODRAFT_493787 [Calocera cornea HHB12733]